MVTKLSIDVYAMSTAPTVTPERSNQTVRKTYPNYKVIVLNDDFNTFQHVVDTVGETLLNIKTAVFPCNTWKR